MLTSALGVVTSERLRGMTETTQFKDVRDDVMEDCRKGERPTDTCKFSFYLLSLTNFLYFISGRSVKVAICGGKNVGKSTFARYLVNSMLNVFV